jgi:nucleoside-diphosphate-sugar epimerase
MASVMEWIWRTFSRQGEPPMTRQMLRLIGAPFTLDIGKAQRELGYRPVVSRESGLMAMQAI